MKKMLVINIACFLLILCSPQNAISEENAGETTTKVRPEFVPYCGCNFSRKTANRIEPFLVWSYAESASILKKNKFTDLENIEENMGKTLGEEGKFKFSNKEIVLTGKVKVTKVCPEKSDNCESTSYQGEVEIIEGDIKTSFPVRGSCGC